MSRLTIKRTLNAADGFVMVPNSVARPGGDLSGLAVAVLVYLLSHRDGFDVTSQSIARQFKNGRDAVRTALRELKDLGYIETAQKRDEAGDWHHYMTVHDSPAESRTGFSGAGDSGAGDQGAGFSGMFQETTDKKTSDQKTSRQALGPAAPHRDELAAFQQLLDEHGYDGDPVEAWHLLVSEYGAVRPLRWIESKASKGELDGLIRAGGLEPIDIDHADSAASEFAGDPDPEVWGSVG